MGNITNEERARRAKAKRDREEWATSLAGMALALMIIGGLFVFLVKKPHIAIPLYAVVGLGVWFGIVRPRMKAQEASHQRHFSSGRQVFTLPNEPEPAGQLTEHAQKPVGNPTAEQHSGTGQVDQSKRLSDVHVKTAPAKENRPAATQTAGAANQRTAGAARCHSL